MCIIRVINILPFLIVHSDHRLNIGGQTATEEEALFYIVTWLAEKQYTLLVGVLRAGPTDRPL